MKHSMSVILIAERLLDSYIGVPTLNRCQWGGPNVVVVHTIYLCIPLGFAFSGAAQGGRLSTCGFSFC